MPVDLQANASLTVGSRCGAPIDAARVIVTLLPVSVVHPHLGRTHAPRDHTGQPGHPYSTVAAAVAIDSPSSIVPSLDCGEHTFWAKQGEPRARGPVTAVAVPDLGA